MKAVLLIGGEATRLRPLTCNIPKAMVQVLNRPFLEHVLCHLSRHQIRDIILTLGPSAKAIEGYLGDGSQFGVRLSYTMEASPLGTAGAVKNAERYLDETCLVLNGDVFTDLDITAMVAFHMGKKAEATIALTPVADPTSYGLVFSDAGGRVTRFLEKPKRAQATTNLINAGTYVLEPDVLARIPPQTKCSFERELFPQLLEQGQPVYAYPSAAYWIDIGTPEKYLQLNRDLLSGRGGAGQNDITPGEGVLVGEPSCIHPAARVKGPIVIGAGGSVMENAVIEESVIWERVRIEPGARVINSIVANDCCLGAGSIVEGSVLGDNVTVPRGGRLKSGSKIWPAATAATD